MNEKIVKKAETIKIGGNVDYAKVSERIKLFREDCPNGLIETEPKIEGNIIMFKCRVLKDKAKPQSAEATGHAIGENKGQKAFEKLESISVGRALAMLGYMASGEIATSEEMEEYMEYVEDKKLEEMLEIQEKISSIMTIEELREFYKENKGKGKQLDEMVMNRKNQLTQAV